MVVAMRWPGGWRTWIAVMGLWGVAQAGAGAAQFQLQFGMIGFPGAVPGRSVAVLAADTAGDGFAGWGDPDLPGSASLASLPFCPGGWLGDEAILLVMEAADVEGLPVFESPGFAGFDTADSVWEGRLAPGQALGLYVFVEGERDARQPWVFYRSDEVTDAELGSDHAYRVPDAGRTATILSASAELGGGVPDAELTAAGGAVGEGGARYAGWVTAVFPPGSSPEATATGADPDGDGASNGEEYAAGTDPAAPDPFPLRVRAGEGGKIRVRFLRALDRSDAVQVLEWSADGRVWQRTDTAAAPDSPAFCFRIDPAEGPWAEVTVLEGPAEAGGLFRLRVGVQPAP